MMKDQTLLDVQKILNEFQAYLIENHETILENLSLTALGHHQKRMEVYKEGYGLRLVQIMKEQFPVLLQCIGQKRFISLSLSYLKTHPSTYDNIRFFGDQFYRYLEEDKKFSKKVQFSELALFEWTLALVQEVVDANIVTQEMLKEFLPEDWPLMHLTLHPSIKLLWLYSNAPQLWAKAKKGNKILKWKCSDIPKPYLIWRKGQVAYYQQIDIETAEIIQFIQKGYGFINICEELLQIYEEETAPMKLAKAIQFLLVRDGISLIELKSSIDS